MDDDLLAREVRHEPRRRNVRAHRVVEPAPRIVLQPEWQSTWKPPLLLKLVLGPINLLYRFLSASSRIFAALFGFLPSLSASRITARSGLKGDIIGREALNARETTARFIRQFEEDFGHHGLSWHNGSYAQAYDIASKEVKFLLIVLISPEHDGTNAWTRETLLSSEVVCYLNEQRDNIILWGGNVLDSEAYQVSTALSCTQFPFAALLSLVPTRAGTSMSILARMSGSTPPRELINKLQSVVSVYEELLAPIRAERSARQVDRTIRREQETAYERSLKQDQERSRRKREALAQQEKEEREQRERAEAAANRARDISQWKRWRARRIPSEPGLEVKSASRISVRLPSGERIVRRFAPDTTMDDLYATVECYEELQSPSEKEILEPSGYTHIFGFQLVSPIPRQIFLRNGTVGEKIGRSGNLMVESLEESDDEEDT